jgi:hypothetical protein
VYPPDYDWRVHRYQRVRSWRRAKKLVKAGSEVHRSVHVHPGRFQDWISSFVSYVWQVATTTEATKA